MSSTFVGSVKQSAKIAKDVCNRKHDTGLKLFGNYAFYTMNGGKVVAYMTESGAKKATPKGPVYTYEQILAKV